MSHNFVFHMLFKHYRKIYLTSVGLTLVGLVSSANAQGYNLKMGPLRFNLTGSMGIEFNSNVNSSGENPLSDIIFTPGIDTTGSWNITDVNALSFDLGIAYRQYLKNGELSSGGSFLDIKPDSQLTFDVYSGNFTVTLKDELQFSSDPTDAFVVDPASNQLIFDIFEFSRFYNDASISVNWDVSSLSALRLTFNREDVFPLESRFNRARRVQYIITPAYYRQISSALLLGINGSYRVYSYSVSQQNDSTGQSVGLIAEWSPSQFLTINGSVSGLFYNFDSNGENSDNSDVSTIIYGLSISNTLNSSWSHSVGISRAVDFGFIANSNLTHTFQYNFVYSGINQIEIEGGVLFNKGRDSGGIDPEKSDRINFIIGTSYQFNPKWKSSIKYSFTDRDSNFAARDFNVNKLLISAFYDF